MKNNLSPERMGRPLRGHLERLVGLMEGPAPETEEDWNKVLRDVRDFAMDTSGMASFGAGLRDIDVKAPPREAVVSSKTLREALNKASYGVPFAVLQVLERVARRDIFHLLQQPAAAQWDAAKQRYVPIIDPDRDTFSLATLRGLHQCVFEHGRLLKECQAAAKVKPGRKRKDEPTPTPTICGKLFVAKKQTQLYCSGACLNRTLMRKKRAGKGVAKAHARRKRMRRGSR